MTDFRTWRWRPLVGGGVLLAGSLALWLGIAEPIRSRASHRGWYERVRADLMSLVHRRPPGVTKGQWDYAVGWTFNLHANCGTPDRSWRDGFAVELERRLQGPVTLADIEWIWDEYARNTSNGQAYSDRWRPTQDRELGRLEAESFGLGVH
jgi:hypothetical protein